MKFAYHTDIGRHRQVNQDQACVLENQAGQCFGIVCDGMGGHQAGELASQLALDALCQAFMENAFFTNSDHALRWLIQTVENVNALIFQDARQHPDHEGMGTTLVCCLVLEEVVIICHVGDSRAYLYADHTLQQMTQDHTYVNLLVENGSINKEQAKYHPQKNVLMKALGVFEHLVVSTQIIPRIGGIWCLCSDGLYNCLDEDEMIDLLEQDVCLEEKVMLMIQNANEHGGYDNISVVLIDDEGGVNHE